MDNIRVLVWDDALNSTQPKWYFTFQTYEKLEPEVLNAMTDCIQSAAEIAYNKPMVAEWMVDQ